MIKSFRHNKTDDDEPYYQPTSMSNLEDGKDQCCRGSGRYHFNCEPCNIKFTISENFYLDGREFYQARLEIIKNHCIRMKHDISFSIKKDHKPCPSCVYKPGNYFNSDRFIEGIRTYRPTAWHPVDTTKFCVSCAKYLVHNLEVGCDTYIKEVKEIKEDIKKEIGKYRVSKLMENPVSINKYVYEYVDCPCGKNKFVRCNICGVHRNIPIDKRKYKDSMYATILMDHFGVNRKEIKFNMEDFVIPANDLSAEFLVPNTNVQVRSYEPTLVKKQASSGFKCAICDKQYGGTDMPPEEIIESHFSVCIENVKKLCRELGIEAEHSSCYGKQYGDFE